MKVERIPDIFLLIPILITSFLLNIWGIDWGVPSIVRNKLYFENKEQIEMTLKGVTVEKVRESQTTKELKGSRFNPVRSYHPDESQFIESLSNMNPKKFDFNPHYFYYGVLYFWFFGFFCFLAYLVGYLKLIPDLTFFYFHPEEMAKFYITGRMVLVIFGVLCVLMTFLLARKIYGRNKALISALLLAVTPLFVIYTHKIEVDMMMVFFILVVMFVSLRLLETGKTKYYIWGGIFTGLAANSKYPGVAAILFIPVACFLRDKSNWKNLLGSFVGKKSLLAYLFAVGSFILTCPYIITSFSEIYTLLHTFSKTTQGLKGNNIFSGVLYYSIALYTGMGLPLLLLSLLGVGYVLYKRNKADILILFWIIISFLSCAFVKQRYDKYIIVAVPFLIILSGRGLEVIKNRYAKGVILLVVIIFTFLLTLGYELVFIQENTRTTTGKWIAQNIPRGEKIGLARDCYQFETPPLNYFKYNVCVIGLDLGLLEKEKPAYFILSEAEYLLFKPHQGWEGWMEEGGYKLVKTISNPPKILGIPFNHKKTRNEYLHYYPQYFIYQPKE